MIHIDIQTIQLHEKIFLQFSEIIIQIYRIIPKNIL